MSDSSSSSDREANGRFAKGWRGGPGRPRNPVSTAAQELDRLGVEAARELMGLILERARQGNLKAAEMVLQRVWPVRRNRPVDFDLHIAPDLPNLLGEHVDVVDAMMNGDITPQEARVVTRVLKALQDQIRESAPLLLAEDHENEKRSSRPEMAKMAEKG